MVVFPFFLASREAHAGIVNMRIMNALLMPAVILGLGSMGVVSGQTITLPTDHELRIPVPIIHLDLARRDLDRPFDKFRRDPHGSSLDHRTADSFLEHRQRGR